MQISIEEAAEQLEDLAALVGAGEEVVLTRAGMPVVRMILATDIPQESDARIQLDFLK